MNIEVNETGGVSDISSLKKSDEPGSQMSSRTGIFVTGYLIIFVGAIMVLISTTMIWYRVKFYSAIILLNFSNLVDNHYLEKLFEQDYNSLFTSLPVILTILWASIAILLIAYSAITRNFFKQPWGWLCLLSVASLVTNYFYMRAAVIHEGFTPQVGWVLALTGALVMGMGALVIIIGNRKKFYNL